MGMGIITQKQLTMVYRLFFKAFIISVILHGCPLYASPSVVEQLIHQRIDSLFDSNQEKITTVEMIGENPAHFTAITAATIDYPFDLVKKNCTNFKDFETIFHLFDRFIEITDTGNDTNGRRRFYFEIQAFLVGAWCVFQLDTVVSNQNDVMKIHFSQHMSDTALLTRWRDYFERRQRWYTVHLRHYTTTFYARRISDTQTRIVIAASAVPPVRLPRWIFSFVGKRALPRMLRDIDRYLESL